MEISDRNVLGEIIRGCTVCRLGLSRGGEPYVVPVSFGYDDGVVYFHTGKSGRKIEFIEANDRVCVEFERGVGIVPDDNTPCKWSFRYESVIGYGRVTELLSAGEKIEALAYIMRQYSDREWRFGEKAVRDVRVWRISIVRVTGKRSKG